MIQVCGEVQEDVSVVGCFMHLPLLLSREFIKLNNNRVLLSANYESIEEKASRNNETKEQMKLEGSREESAKERGSAVLSMLRMC